MNLSAAEAMRLMRENPKAMDELLLPGKHLTDIELEKLKIDVLPSGFKTLDDYKFLKRDGSELIIVGGRPSMGKSAFMFQLAFNVSHMYPVHIFSLEMGHNQILTRVLASKTGQSITDIQDGNADPDLLEAGYEELKHLRYIVDDRGGLSVQQICDSVRQRRKTDGTQLVVVDYLQMITTEKTYSRNDEIGLVTKALKDLAKEINIPIIVGSQLNRQNELRGAQYGDFKPILSDLRDSGNIEQDADIIMFVHRESKYKDTRHGEADLIIAKNRNGACGDIVMNYVANQTKFVDRKK